MALSNHTGSLLIVQSAEVVQPRRRVSVLHGSLIKAFELDPLQDLDDIESFHGTNELIPMEYLVNTAGEEQRSSVKVGLTRSSVGQDTRAHITMLNAANIAAL